MIQVKDQKFGLIVCLYLLFWVCTGSCNRTTHSKFAVFGDFTVLKEVPDDLQGKEQIRLKCSDTYSYIPDTDLDQVFNWTIRTVIHIMNSSDSTHNYGFEEGIAWALSLIESVNRGFQVNQKMNLPPGNGTPVFPIGLRLRLEPAGRDSSGVFFHFDDDLYYFVKQGRDRNNTSRAVIEKYSYLLDSVVNIFVMPHHPDSAASSTYRADYSGITLGHAIKIAGMYEDRQSADYSRGLVSHEVGHLVGLTHSWTGDGCDDTPNHPNCWNVGDPPCDGITSNNVMDYNAFQSSWTPCQIGKMNRSLSNTGSNSRKILLPTWCDLDEDRNVEIRDTVIWEGARDLGGHLILSRNSMLVIRCRVSIPADGKIIIHPGAVLVLDDCELHNSCERSWQGIEILKTGRKSGSVQVVGNPRFRNTNSFVERS